MSTVARFLKAANERAAKAHRAICEVAEKGDRAFRMSIPPQDDDTDLLVSAVASDSKAMAAMLEDAFAALKKWEETAANVRSELSSANPDRHWMINELSARSGLATIEQRYCRGAYGVSEKQLPG